MFFPRLSGWAAMSWRPPSGAVGCAPRPTCRKCHRPAAVFFSTQPAGARAGAPEGGRAPRDQGATAPVAKWMERASVAPAWVSRSVSGGTPDLPQNHSPHSRSSHRNGMQYICKFRNPDPLRKQVSPSWPDVQTLHICTTNFWHEHE
jgi:hypothetical protein